jgi:hypothetical protein
LSAEIRDIALCKDRGAFLQGINKIHEVEDPTIVIILLGWCVPPAIGPCRKVLEAKKLGAECRRRVWPLKEAVYFMG